MIDFDIYIPKCHNNDIVYFITSMYFLNLDNEEIEQFNTYLASQDINQLNAIYLTMNLQQSKITPGFNLPRDLDFYKKYSKVMPLIEKRFFYESLKNSLQHIEVKNTSTIKI